MAEMPMLEGSRVQTRPASTQYADATVSPNAFGAGLGRALQAVGQDLGDIEAKERALDVEFAAADAELKLDTSTDDLVTKYKEDLKTAAVSGGDFSAAVKELRVKYSKKMEETRAGHAKNLADPLAVHKFTIRSGLKSQGVQQFMADTGEQAISEWRGKVADGRVEQAVRSSGNVTGNVATDVANLQTNVSIGVKTLQDLHKSQGLPPEYTAKITAQIEEKAAEQALAGYGSNNAAGMAFLAATLPGTNVRVGFNPSKPDEPSILNGADTQKWVEHFAGMKKEKVGADLGEALFQGRGEKGFDLETRLAALYKTGQYTGDEIGRARQHYTSAVAEAEQRKDIAIGNTYDSAYKLLVSKYDGDIEKAIKAKDERFLRMWSVLGPKQGNLRAALAKDDRLDPAAYSPLGKVIDISATPGEITRLYPTAEVFAAEFQGPTKHLWPQALAIYSRDKQRDTSQDTNYQVFRQEVETSARRLGEWKNWNKGWEERPIEMQNMHLWITASAEQAWAAHQEARKSTPGAKTTDVLWYVDTLNGIMRQAESMKKKGTFERTVPPIQGPPESATAVTKKGYGVGDTISSEALGTMLGKSLEPGDQYTFDGTNWQKVRKP